jgi:hypothetical protein
MIVACKPVRRRVLPQPLRRDDGKVVEGVAQRLTDDFAPIEGAHRVEHPAQRAPGRIGSLSPARPEEFLPPAPGKQPIERERCRAACDQARAKRRQDRGSKAGSGQSKPRDAFPVDPAAHGGREDRDESKPPRGEGGLSLGGKSATTSSSVKRDPGGLRGGDRDGLWGRSVGDPGGLLRNGADGLWAEHGDPP